MERKLKVKYQGEQVDGIEMDFKTRKEEWNEYELQDGTIIKMKLVASTILKLVDKVDADGNPIYTIKSTNVVGISVPEHLEKEQIH
jgi:hypothetical protein